MKYILCITIVSCTLLAAENIIELCPNGVFRCVSPNSLRICFYGQLVTSEFYCPNSTYCSESSSEICTNTLRDYDYYDSIHTEDHEEKLQINPDLKCTESGSFPIANTRCKKYYKCIPKGSGFLIKELICNKGFFDPLQQSCSNNYVCPEVDCNPREIPKCTEAGKLGIPNSGCKNYVTCIETENGFESEVQECYVGYWNPIRNKCDKTYICTETTKAPVDCTTTTEPTTPYSTTTESTTTESTTTEATTTTTTDSNTNTTTDSTTATTTDSTTSSLPECTIFGKFPVPNTNCSKYISCLLTSEGFLQQIYECLPNTYFDPDAQTCTTYYVCPDTVTTTQPVPTITETTTIIITEPSTKSTEPSIIVTDPSTKSTEPSTVVTEPASTPTPLLPECTSSGKFPIPNTNCAQYLLCLTTSEGFLTQIYNCPLNTYFNPDTQRCSIVYVCDEKNTTIPLPGETTTTPDPITTTTTETTTTTTTDITTTTTVEPTSTPRPLHPECTTPGKFPIPNTNCSQYLLCSATSEGFLPQIYNCPLNSYFNPDTQRCSTFYVCDEKNTTIPLPGETTTTPDPITTTTTETTTTTTTDITTTTTAEPTSTPRPFHPECTTSGKFPIPNTNCSQYLLCSATSEGFLPQIYNCPLNSYFNPDTQRCSTFYVCDEKNTTIPLPGETTTTPDPITTTTTETTTTTTTDTTTTTTDITTTTTAAPSCTTAGKFPVKNTNCTKYLLCVVSTQGFLEQIFPCPQSTLFDPAVQRCVTYYKCQETVSTTTEEPSTPMKDVTSPEVPTGSCKLAGIFPISDTNCTKYLLCSVTSTGFLEQTIVCSSGTNFDPNLKRCSETYICPELTTTSNTIVVTTPSSQPCDQMGKFVIANTACKKFRFCLMTNIGFEFIEYECPNGTLFDSQLEVCSDSYTCNENNSTNALNQCTEIGKFPTAGSGCKKYVLCTETQLGFAGTEYECPGDTNFDPTNQRCSQSYQCAEKECSTPGLAVSTELPTTTEIPSCLIQGKQEVAGTKCGKFVLCVETTHGFVSAVYTCPIGTYFDPVKKHCTKNYICEEYTMKCTTIGRYPDPNDDNCEYYYDCTEEVDSVQGTRNKCTTGHYFDPEIQQCSASYNCPKKTSLVLRAKRQTVISPRFLVNGQCTTVGRYAVQLTNCKNYVYCSVNTDGTLRATNFICPTTTVFNQAIQKCTSTASFTCPDSFCVNNPGFLSWANPNVRDCSSYIVCQQVFDSNTGIILGWSGVIMYCPQNTRFNPMLQICDQFYVCPTNNG